MDSCSKHREVEMKAVGWQLWKEYRVIIDLLWAAVFAPVLAAYRQGLNLKVTKSGKKAGRRAVITDRVVVNTVLYVMITGTIWNSVYPDKDGELCLGNTAHHVFSKWKKAGVWDQIFESALYFFNRICPITFNWSAIDGTKVKAIFGGECTGRNPTDRGFLGTKISLMVELAYGLIVSMYYVGANVHDSKCLEATFKAVSIEPPATGEKHVCLDNAYQGMAEVCRAQGYIPHICPRGEERRAKLQDPTHINRRWIGERTNDWFKTPRKVGRRFEKTIESYVALGCLSATMIALRTLFRQGILKDPSYTFSWPKHRGGERAA